MNSPLVPARNISSTLQEEVLSVVLPSGLRVMFCPKPGFKKRYACYSTFYGSVDNSFIDHNGAECRVPDGIAHFLEHMLFETEEGNVSDLFSRNGAYNNAATSFTTTTYLFASSDRFYENLKLLINFVEKPVFHPDKVEKERGIIDQEIKGYGDEPSWVSYMGVLENLFAKHPMRIDIAGTSESIQEIDSDLLHRCYRTFYSARNMILFVVGDLDASELFDFVAANSVAPDGASVARPVERRYPDESPGVFRSEAQREMAVALPKLLVGFKDQETPMTGVDAVLHELTSDLALEILFGRSSDTYQSLYEQQLIMDDFGASYSQGAGVGYAMVGGDTPEPDRLHDVLHSSLNERLTAGINAEDFDREKRRFIGGFIASFNSLEYIASHYTYYEFHEFNLFEAVDLLSRVTLDSVMDRLRSLVDASRSTRFTIEPRS